MAGDIDSDIVDFVSTETCTTSDLILACHILYSLCKSLLLKVLTKEQNHPSPFNYETKSLSILLASSGVGVTVCCVTFLKNVPFLTRFLKRHSEIREFS